MRHEKYLDSSDTVKEMYAGENTGALLRKTAQANGVTDEAYRVFANVVGDIILGFEEQQTLSALLQEKVGLPAESAENIVSDLKEFLSQRNSQQPSLERSVTQEKPAGSPILQATRTMQSDIASAREGEKPQWRTLLDNEEPNESVEQTPEKETSQEETSGNNVIPRYSKPLTDTPKYD